MVVLVERDLLLNKDHFFVEKLRKNTVRLKAPHARNLSQLFV